MGKFLDENSHIDGDENFLSASGKERKEKRTAKKAEKAAKKASQPKPTPKPKLVKEKPVVTKNTADEAEISDKKIATSDKLKTAASLLGMGLAGIKNAKKTEPEPLKKSDNSKMLKYILASVGVTAIVAMAFALKSPKK